MRGTTLSIEHTPTFQQSTNIYSGVSHRWLCSCGTKGKWHRRNFTKTFDLWLGHVGRRIS